MIRLAQSCATCKFARFNNEDVWLKNKKTWIGLCMLKVTGEEPPTITEPPKINQNEQLTDLDYLRWELTNEGRYIAKGLKVDRLTLEKYLGNVKQFLLTKKETASNDPDSQMWWENRIEEEMENAKNFFTSVLANYDWWKSNQNKIQLITKQTTCKFYEDDGESDKTGRAIIEGDDKYQHISI